MSVNLLNIYGKQFASNVQMLLQQQMSKLRPTVTEGSYKGEAASPVDQVAAVEMQEITGRLQPVERTDAVLSRRWVSPSAFDLTQYCDSFDKLQVLSDPQSVYTKAAVAAANRKIDSIIATNFFGTNYVGKAGTTTQAFTSGNQIAVNFKSSGNVGATVAKYKEALRILLTNEVDMERDEIYAIVTAKQHDDLLNETQAISLDYRDRPVLEEGRIRRFLGMNFIIRNGLPVTSTPYRRCPVYAKSGVHLGLWQDIQTNVEKDINIKGHPYQIYCSMMIGATRLEETKCVEVICNEA